LKKPRLLNLAAGVSLLLAVAIVFLWVRSHERREGVSREWKTSTEFLAWNVESRYSSLELSTSRGLEIGRPTAPQYFYFDQTDYEFVRSPKHGPHWFPRRPVWFEHHPASSHVVGGTDLIIAYWLLLLPTLVLPAIAIVRHRRRRRRETNNLCPTCGYDLRATPDRCPECGASAPHASAVT